MQKTQQPTQDALNVKYSNLDPTVKKLGLISFFADVASEMLYPITPIFLTTVLGASMSSLGFIEGLAEAIASLMKTYSGFWSDRISKRKPFVVVGYFLAAIAKPLIGISTNWSHVLLARAVDRTGKGIRTAPRDAMIADVTNAQNRGAAFGWHRAMDTFGAAVGPLLTIAFISSSDPNHLRQLYWWALVPGLIAVAIAMSLKEKNEVVNSENINHKKNKIEKWKLSELNSDFKKYMIAWGIFSLANSSDVFLLMKAKSIGFSLTQVILAYCGYNLIYALSAPYLGKLSDSLSRKSLMIFGLVVFIFVYFGFGVATEKWQIAVLFLIYGLYMGATDGVGKALAVDFCPQHLKATALGVLGTVTGLATIVASAVAGIIWDNMSSSYTFYYGALGAFLAIIVMLGLKSSAQDNLKM